MKIACGWDHHGREFRETVERLLTDMGHEFVDMGAPSEERSDYPDFAFKVAEAVSRGEVDRGMLICGTGIGMSIAANKVMGVRAGVVHDEETARLSRSHNNGNVLCVGETTVRQPGFEDILKIWLTTDFEGGRHAVRVSKIMGYDEKRGGKSSA